MSGMGRQRGFVHSSIMDLAFLLVMILVAIGVGWWLTTLFGGDFALGFFMIWIVAVAGAGWWAHGQKLVLRVPAGIWVLLGLSAVLLPLSWWSGSKLITAAEAGVAAFAAVYLGGLWSKRVEERLKAGTAWYLDQRINLINDLFRWLFACIVAWFVVGVLPLALIFVMPPEYIVWGALAWAFACIAWYSCKFQPSRVRLLRIPADLWMLAAAAAMVRLLQRWTIGPLETGSIAQIGYLVCLPVVIAIFVKIVMLSDSKTATARIA